VYGFLLVILILVGLFMGVVIMLQAGKGGGLASMGGGAGTDSLIGGRQAATLLTKATWVSGGIFLTLSLLLSIMSSRQATATGGSILRGEFQAAPPPATQPIVPGTSPLGEPGPAADPGAPAQQPAPAPTTGQ
jgi:preprotein translocase subunit SecG